MSKFLEKHNGNKNDEQDDGAQICACTQIFLRRFAQARHGESVPWRTSGAEAQTDQGA